MEKKGKVNSTPFPCMLSPFPYESYVYQGVPGEKGKSFPLKTVILIPLKLRGLFFQTENVFREQELFRQR